MARATVKVHVVIEGKTRQAAQINAVELRSIYGTNDRTVAAPQCRIWDYRGRPVIDQLSVYRWSPARVYPPGWEISDAVFVLLTADGYDIPDGWEGADLEALATLLLAAGARRANPHLLAPVAALIAPSEPFPWRGIRSHDGRRIAYKTLGLARSWQIWNGHLRLVYLDGAGFGLILTARGWWPATLEGTPLDPATLPAETLDSYAASVELHGDRAGWQPCRWLGCEAGPNNCGHVDQWGSEATAAPAAETVYFAHRFGPFGDAGVPPLDPPGPAGVAGQ